jgi:hypothetical protein
MGVLGAGHRARSGAEKETQTLTPERKLRELIAKWREYSANDAQSDDGRYNEPIGTYMHGQRLACADELEKLLAAAPAPTSALPAFNEETVKKLDQIARRVTMLAMELAYKRLQSFTIQSTHPEATRVRDICYTLLGVKHHHAEPDGTGEWMRFTPPVEPAVPEREPLLAPDWAIMEVRRLRFKLRGIKDPKLVDEAVATLLSQTYDRALAAAPRAAGGQREAIRRAINHSRIGGYVEGKIYCTHKDLEDCILAELVAAEPQVEKRGKT